MPSLNFARNILAADNFDRPGPGLGSNWTTVYAGMQISNKVVIGTQANQNQTAFWNQVWWLGDQYAEITLMGFGNGTPQHANPCLALRCDTSGLVNYYQGLIGGEANDFFIEIWKLVNNVPTLLATTGPTQFSPQVGDILRFDAVGSMLRMKLNGVQQLSVQDATFNSGAVGMSVYNNDAAVKLTNFVGGIVPLNYGRVFDSFGRADGAIGENWNPASGSFSIVGQRATGGSPSVYNAVFWAADQFPGDQYSQATVSGAINPISKATSVWVRVQPTSFSGYMLQTNSNEGNDWAIMKIVNGTFTELGHSGVNSNSGDISRLEVRGTKLTAFVNGTQVLQLSDSTFGSGSPGIGMFGSSQQDFLTSWSGGSLLLL
jgi:hypothetical protein